MQQADSGGSRNILVDISAFDNQVGLGENENSNDFSLDQNCSNLCSPTTLYKIDLGYRYERWFTIFEIFYNGHSKILSLFNCTMEDLLEDRLLQNLQGKDCNELPDYLPIRERVLKTIADYWRNESQLSLDDQQTNIPKTILFRKNISPIQLIDYYERQPHSFADLEK
uniref:Uncharacterized protein n=1 Tax=Ditylenchus dipsaci TaxID=166011 RepID=A0A915CX06_9BILA